MCLVRGPCTAAKSCEEVVIVSAPQLLTHVLSSCYLLHSSGINTLIWMDTRDQLFQHNFIYFWIPKSNIDARIFPGAVYSGNIPGQHTVGTRAVETASTWLSNGQ